jgi:hypothetical protein
MYQINRSRSTFPPGWWPGLAFALIVVLGSAALFCWSIACYCNIGG